jgi:hypothetical protein
MNAGIVYDFSVTTPGNGVDPIAFSVTSPSYITYGAFDITAFSITRGPEIWTFTKGAAGPGVFVFGTITASISCDSVGCGFSASWGPVPAGTIDFVFDLSSPSLSPGFLPDQDATFTTYGWYDLVGAYTEYVYNHNLGVGTGGLRTIVSTVATPEPASVGLFMIGLGLRGFRLRQDKQIAPNHLHFCNWLVQNEWCATSETGADPQAGGQK